MSYRHLKFSKYSITDQKYLSINVKCIIWISIFHIYLLVMNLSNKLDQVLSFQNSWHQKQHNVALVTLVIGNTIAYINLVQVEQVKCFILVNIFRFLYFYMDFSTKWVQIQPFQNSGHRKGHNMSLVILVIRNTIA